MLAIIVAAIMLMVSIVLLIQKGRGRLLFGNLAFAAVYETLLVIGMINAKGWDGIPFFLAALGLGGVHLLVLFILSLALPDLKAQRAALEASGQPIGHADSLAMRSERRQAAMRQLPEQDRGKVRPIEPLARQAAETRAIPATEHSPSSWDSRQKSLLSRLDDAKGGELEFD